MKFIRLSSQLMPNIPKTAPTIKAPIHSTSCRVCLFFTPFCLLQPALLSGCLFPILFIVSTMILNYYFQKAKVLFFFLVNNPTNMVFCNLVIFFGLFLCLYHYFL
ncbi:Uncharacterised protein [Segatella copri]|nr:Uncharacterised protein [Segatella copri]